MPAAWHRTGATARVDRVNAPSGAAGVRPGVLDAAVQAQRLLLHHRGRPTRARARFVAAPERVPDLVVDEVLPVAGEVVGVLVGARDPAREREHGTRAAAA